MNGESGSEDIWEKKDRRIAWMNINTACSNILSARINANILKHKTNEDAIKDLLNMVNIEFNAFLNIDLGKENKLDSKDESRICERCARHNKDTKISQGIAEFSFKNYGEQLCMDCQKEVRRRNG